MGTHKHLILNLFLKKKCTHTTNIFRKYSATDSLLASPTQFHYLDMLGTKTWEDDTEEAVPTLLHYSNVWIRPKRINQSYKKLKV